MKKSLEEIISNLKDKKEVKNLLKGLLTTKEYSEILNRLEIIRLLKKGLPQSEIAEKLGVGIATVTRGSKALQDGDFKILDRYDN